MIRLMPKSCLMLTVTLSACGNLEWPPNSGGNHYSVGDVGLVNTPINHNKIEVEKYTQQVIKDFQNNSTKPSSIEHVVVAGETLWRIAQAYNSDIYELAILNQIQPPFRIFVGQRLLLSDNIRKPIELAAFKRTEVIVVNETLSSRQLVKNHLEQEAPVGALSSKDVAFLTVQPGTKPKSSRKKSGLSRGAKRPLKVKKRKTSDQVVKLPSVRKGSLFIWPLNGSLISSFGAKGDGLHNDGINIVAPTGSIVRAAGAGVVAYAGNELRGFGNLLLIKHGKGWVTAYAHNRNLIVRKGERVEQGQAIAYVGSSGNVSRPQLHFEIRKGNKAIDPISSIGRIKRRRAAVKMSRSKS